MDYTILSRVLLYFTLSCSVMLRFLLLYKVYILCSLFVDVPGTYFFLRIVDWDGLSVASNVCKVSVL